MSLEKLANVDQIEVVSNGIVQVRTTITITENGNQISKSYHRTSLTPGQDLTGQPAKVVAICNAAWTPEVIVAYQAQMAEQEAKMGG